MAEGAILVVDAGTSAPRCLVFDRAACVLGSSSGAWRHAAAPDAPALAREFHLPTLWPGLSVLVRSALRDAGTEPSRVNAVAVTGQRQAIVFLDEAGRELYAGPNLDLRAVFEGAQLDAEETAGRRPSMLFAHAKLRWFREHRPEAYARIAHVLTLPDWIAWKLTGEVASNPALAAEAGLLDVHTERWDGRPFDEAGIDPAAVRLLSPGEFAGAVHTDAARQTGLCEGVPVSVAGPDTQCGLLGMDVADAGGVGVVAGWSVPLQMVTEAPLPAPGSGAWTGLFLEGGKGVLECNAGDLGNQQRWLAEVLFGDAHEGLKAMNALAAEAPQGAHGATALFGHPRMATAAVGMRTGGLLFPAPVTFSEIGRGHIVRAQMESAAFTIRTNLEQLERAAEVHARVVRLGGGMTRMPVFGEIVAAVLGRKIGVSSAGNVSALGAFVHATATLEGRSASEMAASVAPIRLSALDPDPLAVAEYEDAYRRWTALTNDMEGWTL